MEAEVVGACETRLWALSSSERLSRQLAGLGVALRREGGEPVSGGGLVLLRADHLFDDRVLAGLVEHPGAVLVAPASSDRSSRPVGVHLPDDRRSEGRTLLLGDDPAALPDLPRLAPDEIAGPYQQDLLKAAAPAVLPISPARRTALERHLFAGSYKGVTDFVTKWVWPAPARWVTGACAALGIAPNAVTWTSVILVLLATVCFWTGRYGTGLALAWAMTFLDTVDGKLARVTVRSSTFGHFLDHGLDVVHPPFWYLAWGMGLGAAAGALPGGGIELAMGVIVAGYLAGRLLEAAFTYWLATFSMFIWRPVDSWVRLVLARRNPNLVILSVSWLLGRPDQGLVVVAAWTALSSVFLLVRLGQAVAWRGRQGELRPWILEPASTRWAAPFAVSIQPELRAGGGC